MIADIPIDHDLTPEEANDLVRLTYVYGLKTSGNNCDDKLRQKARESHEAEGGAVCKEAETCKYPAWSSCFSNTNVSLCEAGTKAEEQLPLNAAPKTETCAEEL